MQNRIIPAPILRKPSGNTFLSAEGVEAANRGELMKKITGKSGPFPSTLFLYKLPKTGGPSLGHLRGRFSNRFASKVASFIMNIDNEHIWEVRASSLKKLIVMTDRPPESIEEWITRHPVLQLPGLVVKSGQRGRSQLDGGPTLTSGAAIVHHFEIVGTIGCLAKSESDPCVFPREL